MEVVLLEPVKHVEIVIQIISSPIADSMMLEHVKRVPWENIVLAHTNFAGLVSSENTKHHRKTSVLYVHLVNLPQEHL